MKTTDKYADRDNFSQIIRQKLENYSLPVAADSWGELEKRLNAKPKRKMALWHWVSGVSAAASITLVVIFSYQTQEKEFSHATNSLSYHEERFTESLSVEENVSSIYLPTIQTQTENRSRQTVSGTEEFALRERDVVSLEETVREDKEQSDPEETNTPQNPPVNSGYRQGNLKQEPVAPWKPKNKSRSLALHISSGGRQYTMNNTLIAAAQDNYSGLRAGETSGNSSLLSENPNECNQITHYPPVAIGLSLRKALNDYLSIESGLMYSNLYSTYEAKVLQADASLTLHYLGIPVNLAVNLYPRSRSSWNVYISAGGMVEKGLLVHYRQSSYRNSITNTISSDERIQGLQWSVQSAIGVSYRFSRDYSIFLEPKIIYYLDNNQPFNIRTAYPLVPGINVGIRHTW
jgi:hypothetical protein